MVPTMKAFLLIPTIFLAFCKINAQFSTFDNRCELTDDEVTRRIIKEVSAENICAHLRYLSALPHHANTTQNNILADYVSEIWKKQGLENVNQVKYEVLLSFPNFDHPNEVNMVSKKHDLLYKSASRQKGLHSPEEFHSTAIPTFNAYSRSGIVEGQPVYVNYGRQEDYDWIVQNGISIKGRIVLARYGKAARSNIARRAEYYNASGVVLFSDPANFAPEGRNNVYPKTEFLPGSGAESGSIIMFSGDPLTPYYPSIDGAFRVDVKDARLPNIMSQPISYDDAEQILKLMDGLYPPPDWVGKLNATYRVGPGFSIPDLKLQLKVNTHTKKATITNVFASIRGTVEPDRYIILGNHRDAWVHGASDPSSGMATLLEVTRVFSKLLKEGWQPKRSIIVASWDGEEAALIGSYEWVEEHLKLLKDRAVAYLNVDTAVGGTYALRARGVPSMYRVMYDAAKKIPNPDPEEVVKGRSSMYDTWLLRRPDHESPILNETLPKIHKLASSSDFAPFIHRAGIPSLEYRHLPKDLAVPPVYHTLYDTFHNLNTNVDPGLKFHKAMAQLWAETARSLIDAHILPLNMVDYANYLQSQYMDFETKHGDALASAYISIEYFKNAVKDFKITARHFTQSLARLNEENKYSISVRAANDKLMQVERAFTQPEGLPNSPHMNHVVFATSSLNALSDSAFSTLKDMIFQAETYQDWKEIEKQLAATVYFINCATNVLGDI